MFSPVKKVSYSIENAREGKSLDYDKLVMNIETDGSLSAEDAVAYAARIFQDQLALFVIHQKLGITDFFVIFLNLMDN